MNIVFMGTPEFAAINLQALINSQHNIIAIFTKPDTKQGRGQQLRFSPVKKLALHHNIPVFQPTTLKNYAHVEILQQADVGIVAAYGLILPQMYLDAPKKYGCINIHASLLPKWRGAAPIQRAIANQDKVTGICIMQMHAGLDTGPILNTATCCIDKNDTSATLFEKLANLAPKPLIEWLDNPEYFLPKAQDDTQATYAHKINKHEALINWNLDATSIEALFRAYTPWPGMEFIHKNICVKIKDMNLVAATTNLSPGQIIIANQDALIIKAKTQAIQIKELQLPNKKACKWEDFYRGQPNFFQAS